MFSPSHTTSKKKKKTTYKVTGKHHISWCIFFRESMKLGCKGNCCAFIYPRYSYGMTQNLHTNRVVFGARTLW